MAKKRKKKAATKKRRRSKVAKVGRRARGGSQKITLSLSGVKRALDVNQILYVVAGILAARAGYGLASRYLPSQDPRLRALLGALVPLVASVLASGKAGVVVPMTVGGAGAVVVDMMAPLLAPMIHEYAPEVAQAIAQGTGAPIGGGMYGPGPVGVLPPAGGGTIADLAESDEFPGLPSAHPGIIGEDEYDYNYLDTGVGDIDYIAGG